MGICELFDHLRWIAFTLALLLLLCTTDFVLGFIKFPLLLIVIDEFWNFAADDLGIFHVTDGRLALSLASFISGIRSCFGELISYPCFFDRILVPAMVSVY